jgi:tetratricopeptide (TPR) repeat protein
VKRDQLAFLVAGFAFGILFGYGLFHAIRNVPDDARGGGAPIAAPQGPAAPTQMGPTAGGGAPMVAEVNRLKRELEERPDDLAVLVRLAHLYDDAAMFPEAIALYERAVAVDGSDPDLLTDLGSSYRNVGEFDRALDLFARASATDPNHWQSLHNTVIVAITDVGRLDVALDAMRRLERIDPLPPDLRPDRLAQLRQALEQAIARQGQDGAATRGS